MESSHNYLHKKFKKQLSIEPNRLQQQQQNEAASEEKAQNTISSNDNNITVPNQSTNQSSSLSQQNISKSSISVEESRASLQSSCISWNEQKPSFDTSSASSIFYKNYPKDHDDEKVPDKATAAGKYVCQYCNLVCSKPSVLQKHIRAHTNERPYPCNSCGFSFKTRSNLYKHCRSRTHANRVMGNKIQENNEDEPKSPPEAEEKERNKPYKPRFHTKHVFKENEENKEDSSKNLLSDHINDIISKNHSIVNSDPYLYKKNVFENNERNITDLIYNNVDEPLNLTKNRKRCMSEVVEPVAQKSLIKELLLKNLNSDMQCPHCKMIFQTVTELELHKLRSCKGFVKPGAKYTRSSSVNVASILTQNKNAFDSIPHLQNSFPLKSPGPFLGKTRLVESDKSKSFSFDDGLTASFPPDRYTLSPLTLEREKKTPVRLFGGEVKITHTTGETKSFKIDNKDDGVVEYSGKISENRVVKSGLQSGGTVLTNKPNYPKEDLRSSQVYENTPMSPSIDLTKLGKPQINFRNEIRPQLDQFTVPSSYPNIMDFSQKAVKLLTPNIKTMPTKFIFPEIEEKPKETLKMFPKITPSAPIKILVNGKVVPHVPGIPGPIVPEEPEYQQIKKPLEVKTDFPLRMSEVKSPKPAEKSPKILEKPLEVKKFARPNSLALKPTTASLKQHHGLTPTMFNQILISPDTPRVAKKYQQQYLHGNYFSYLGLKCSTKPVYCTLNKTQPFYVPHFKKLSMYSEWRQQDTKTEKLFVSGYDSRQRHSRYTVAKPKEKLLVVHSSYKFMVTETSSVNGDKSEDQPKSNTILGGYECNDDYTYVRGRGRGRYVCHQCGIRCKKPSMLKKHIRTHSNDRPYTCSHCNFSFKTKGNLTKHMKSKAHTKNYAASGSGSSTQQSGTQSSESDTEDSGMDSSDESTRREEHEAAYGLLSLAQKTSMRRDSTNSPPTVGEAPHHVLNTEEIAHVSKANYVKNKILDDRLPVNYSHPKPPRPSSPPTDEDVRNLSQFLGKTTINRPLTYPYTSVLPTEAAEREPEKTEPKCIKQFHVIQKYAPKAADSGANCAPISVIKDRTAVMNEVNNGSVPVLKVNDNVVDATDLRKRKLGYDEFDRSKQAKSDEVMDLSMTTEKHQNGVVREKSPGRSNGYAADVNVNYVIQEQVNGESPKSLRPVDYDNSAMETLADIATKQVKLEKNTLAKSVASEFLKIAKNESGEIGREPNAFGRSNQEVSDLIVRPEGNKSCNICAKTFSKASQLRLHMNIHYLERPYRCHSCSVSFRTKGHLQKHERSASHHNKLSSSPALSSSEPRPFKCVDCNIAFRIHGHLAKHLRSKMHIMKLECLAKIPFGLYAELERSNSLLTEINTADGDQCLESLKTLAKKVFMNDPSKLNQVNSVDSMDTDS